MEGFRAGKDQVRAAARIGGRRLDASSPEGGLGRYPGRR